MSDDFIKKLESASDKINQILDKIIINKKIEAVKRIKEELLKSKDSD